MKYFVSHICIFLSLLQLVFAQGDNGERTVIVRNLTFAKVKSNKTVYLYSEPLDAESQGVEIKLKNYLNHTRATIKLKGSRLLVSKSSDAEDAKKEALAHVKISSEWTRVLLVFFPPGQGDKDAYRVLALDDSTQGFPRGSIQSLNLSNQDVRLKLEGRSYELKSGGRKLILDPPVNEANHSAMYAFTKTNNEWRRVGAGLWPHPGSKRILQIFYLDPASGRIKLRGVKDVSIR